MKRTKKQVLSLVTVGYLLVNTVVMSGAVFAETIPSEEVTTSTTSVPTKDTVSSSLPNIPAPAISSYDPTVPSEPEEEKRVLTYEDTQLLEAEKGDSAMPAVVFQTKGLKNGLLIIQGTVSAGRAENQSETILSSLILQRQAETGEWEDTHHFPIGKKGVNLSETDFPFEYSEEVKKTGEASYRLAADYTIKYSNEDEQPQKGSVEIGKVIKVDAEDSEKQTEESTSETQESNEPVNENTTESTEESTETATEQSTVESSGPKKDFKQEGPILIDPSASVGTTSPNTLGENNHIPKMADTYRDAFQRGLGIMPLALYPNKDIAPTTSFEQLTYDVDYNYIEKPVLTARFTSKDRLTMIARIVWNYRSYRAGMPITESEAKNQIDKDLYRFSVVVRHNRWGTKTESIQGNLTKSHLVQYEGDGTEAQLGSYFRNDRNISITHPDMWTWEAWSNNVTEIEFTNILAGDTIWFDCTFKKGYTANSNFNFKFEDPKVEDLTDISTPQFEAIDGKINEVKISKGTYKGDISDDKTDGIFEISTDKASNWTNYTNHTANKVKHTNTKGGPYEVENDRITNLTPGTEYRGRIVLKDWYGNPVKPSLNNAFYTPNNVLNPTMKSETIPTTENNAAATVEGKYTVGGVTPAHAKKVEVAYSLNAQDWTTDQEASSNATINTSTEKVTYELKGLKAKTYYYTRYRVKNQNEKAADSNKPGWSPWSNHLKFQTKNIALAVQKPTFDQSTATTNQITMNSGTYTGDASTNTLLKGTVTRTVPSGGWMDYFTGLNYTANPTSGGMYDSLVINGLEPGTAYLAQVGLPDTNGNMVFSPGTTVDDLFFTLNTVDKPSVDSMPAPTGKYSASATLSGVYGVNSVDTVRAHPDKVEVRISLDNATWDNVNGGSTPKLDSQSVDKPGIKANFTISKMKANTKYYVQYRVQNKGGWSEWSESEEFTTLAGPPSMELINAPKFDFGMLKNENFPQTANLDAASTKNHVELENTILASGWKLTAKLDQLKRTDNPSIVMPWATLSLDINLQKSPDDGVSWTNYATGVIGSPGIVSINSGAAAVPLWSISDPQYSQGLFRTEIDWSKVKLNVPANQTGMYQGNLVWSLDDTP